MSRRTEETRTAIGRAASLGTLYDAHNDYVLSRSIFTDKVPKEAIQSTDIRGSNCELCMNDTLEEKCSKFNVTAGLGASFLGGLAAVSGSGSYLSQNRTSTLVQQASAICNITTMEETLLISNSKLRPLLDPDALEHDQATHVVVGIRWGARSVVTVKSPKESVDKLLQFNGSLGIGGPQGERASRFSEEESSSTSKARLQIGGTETQEGTPETPPHREHIGTLGSLINSIRRTYELKGRIESDNRVKELASSFEFKVNADISMNGNMPTTYEDVCEFIKSMPEAMQKANNGKGVPISYQIVPISEIAKTLKQSTYPNKIVRDLEEDCLTSWIAYFDRMSTTKQKLDDYYDLVSHNKHCVPAKHVDMAKTSVFKAKVKENRLKSDFGAKLYAVRAGLDDMQALRVFLAEQETENTAPEAALAITYEYLDKIKLAKQLQSLGATYMGNNASDLWSQYISAGSKDLYVLYYDDASMSLPNFELTYEKAIDLLKNNDNSYRFIVVDCDVGSQRRLAKALIQQVRGNKVVAQDVVQDHRELADKNLMRCADLCRLERPTPFVPPAGRRIVRIKCPGPHCFVNDIVEWICPACRMRVCFGFTDAYFYCDCGRYAIPDASFKCMSRKHGTSFEHYKDTEALRTVLEALDPFEEYNILILGETGVGKSTFINAFVNYMKFGSLEDALGDDGELQFAIPSEFSFDERRDERDETFHVTVGKPGEFEQFSRKGQSATQRSITYRFELDGKRFSLIDTPGIGDTRGVARDHENVKDILNTLEAVDKIHTVLLLLKPNSARLGPVFDFCLTEILSHLHKDTSKNIVFGCTNARNTNFSFGDTRTPLETLLRQKATGLSLGYHNSFFFDSEAFRYLAAKKLRNKSIGSKEAVADSWVKLVWPSRAKHRNCKTATKSGV